VCANPETINLIRVALPNGETLYTTWQEALAANVAMVMTMGAEALIDWLATTEPAKILLWTGTAAAVALVGTAVLTEVMRSDPAPTRRQRRG
jgi:hypothetical protein